MKQYLLLILILGPLLFSCNGQSLSQGADTVSKPSSLNIGDTVKELDKAIYVVFQDRNGVYWFGSDGQGIYRYDGHVLLQFTTKHGLCNDRIRQILEDSSGNLFINTLNGLSRFDGQQFTTLVPEESSAWMGQPGDLWFKGKNGENGPCRYDGKKLYHLTFPKSPVEDEFYSRHPRMPFSPYEVYCIYQDSRGDIWFGTAGMGICRFDGRSLSWMYERHLTDTKEGGSFGIRSILEDQQGKFWFCNNNYRYQLHTTDSVREGNHFVTYHREEGFDVSADTTDELYYLSVMKDSSDDMWMVTYNRGVWRYDGKNLTHYDVKDGDSSITLFSIYVDHQGILWLGTHQSGVYKFNGKMFEKFKAG